MPVSRPAVFCGTQEREINAAVTMRKFNGTSTKRPHHPHDLEEIGHMTIGEMRKRSVGNLSFESSIQYSLVLSKKVKVPSISVGQNGDVTLKSIHC